MNRSLEIADLIGSPQFKEFHARLIPASPEDVWAALHELRWAELRVTRPLMRMRSLNSPGSRRHGGAFWETMPIPLIQEVEASYALAAGIGRPWSSSGRPLTLDAAELATFDAPGWAKLATDFRLVRSSDGTRLTTETRVVTTDPISRAKFGAYWTLVRPFSGLIRKDILRAVDRAATRRSRRVPRAPRRRSLPDRT